MDYKKIEHSYKTAKVKGLNRCTVFILEHNDEQNTYKVQTPFGAIKWLKAEELEKFGR